MLIYTIVRRPAEHGSVVTSSILGIAAIANAIIMHRQFLAVAFWIPVWLGLFLYDVPFSKLAKNKTDLVLIIMIAAVALFSILENPVLIFPYLIFFLVYYTRIALVRRRKNFISIIAGIGSYVLLFFGTWGGLELKFLPLVTAMFLFLIGSEFAVRAVVTNDRKLLFYNILPAFFFILGPVYIVFSISIVRIISGYSTKKIRLIGMVESIIMVIMIAVIEAFKIIK